MLDTFPNYIDMKFSIFCRFLKASSILTYEHREAFWKCINFAHKCQLFSIIIIQYKKIEYSKKIKIHIYTHAYTTTSGTNLYLHRLSSYPLYIKQSLESHIYFCKSCMKLTTFFCARVCPSFVLVCRLYHVKFQLVRDYFTLSISLYTSNGKQDKFNSFQITIYFFLIIIQFPFNATLFSKILYIFSHICWKYHFTFSIIYSRDIHMCINCKNDFIFF